MDKKLNKLVLCCIGLLCVAAIVYITLDVRSAQDDIYELEQRSNVINVPTKTNFVEEWQEVATLTRDVIIEEDPSTGQVPNPNPGGGVVNSPTGTQDENARYVYDLLIRLGYSHTQACGLLGNIAAESSFIPSRVQGDTHVGSDSCCTECMQVGSGKAHGIIQWDGSRRDNLLQADWTTYGGWYTLGAQMDYMTSELQSNYYSRWVSPENLLNGMPSGGDELSYCTYRFVAYYEVCGSALKDGRQMTYSEFIETSGYDTRYSWAQYYDRLFGGN